MDEPELISGALDALDSAEMSDNRFIQVSDIIRERLELGTRLSTGERLDAGIVGAWGATMLGRLDEAERSAAAAISGLVSGQAPAWVSGAAAWRTYVLYNLGRWDDAMSEAVRMQRAIRKSELRAPWFALNGILAAFMISRARGDVGAADAWRGFARGIFDRSDPEIRTQRLDALFAGRLDEVARLIVEDSELFTGRLDYVALALNELSDRRHPGTTLRSTSSSTTRRNGPCSWSRLPRGAFVACSTMTSRSWSERSPASSRWLRVPAPRGFVQRSASSVGTGRRWRMPSPSWRASGTPSTPRR